MRIGVIGYGSFGKFLTQLLLPSLSSPLRVANRLDQSYAHELESNNSNAQIEFYHLDDLITFAERLDVIILAVSICSLETVLQGCPAELFSNKLVVDVCSVKVCLSSEYPTPHTSSSHVC